MKITKSNIKKHARKIKDVSEEQFNELQEGYEKLINNVRGLDAPMLLVLSVIGLAIILVFRSNLLDLIGLIIFIYPFYLFLQKESHQEGYFEGYYDHMTKGESSKRDSAKEGEGKEKDKKSES